MKNKSVAIQADSIYKIDKNTDTTLLLALEAQKRKYKIFWFEPKDVSFINSKLVAKVKILKLFDDKKRFYQVIGTKRFEISKANVVLIRQNPPFDMNYINSTLFLEIIKNKTKIINDPFSVRNISEKLFSINFMKYMPPTIFTKNYNEIKNFYNKYRKIVIKPINGYGGKNILFINNTFNQQLIKHYLKKMDHVMVQKFLPLIKKGDKRVFIINGKIKGVFKRVPKKNSILSNLGQGGKALKTSLNREERKIATFVAKKLKKQNIHFAGIDLISNKLIGDINITSPTGLKQFKELEGLNLAKEFWDTLKLK